MLAKIQWIGRQPLVSGMVSSIVTPRESVLGPMTPMTLRLL